MHCGGAQSENFEILNCLRCIRMQVSNVHYYISKWKLFISSIVRSSYRSYLVIVTACASVCITIDIKGVAHPPTHIF